MDVADKKSVIRCFSELEKTGEKIDICVNNAGIAKLTPIFEEEQNDDFESLIQTNVMGVWYVTKAVAHHMKNNGIHGSIINIGSVNGDSVPATGGCAYSISKAAVIHLTKILVGELSPHKISINCISPGWFKTPISVSLLDCLVRCDAENRPNQIKDIQELIAHILNVVSTVKSVSYDPR